MMELEPPLTQSEKEWMDEYEAIEAEIIANATRPLPGPLVVKLTIQRVGYRKPNRRPTMAEIGMEFTRNPRPTYPDYYPPQCRDPE